MTINGKGVQDSEHEGIARQIRANQLRLSSELKTSFDYIVVGAGSSGSVVAARLASDLNTQVLLLEAGGTDETDLITDPNNCRGDWHRSALAFRRRAEFASEWEIDSLLHG
jgi:choline dehydrogenase-like flavoprotein